MMFCDFIHFYTLDLPKQKYLQILTGLCNENQAKKLVEIAPCLSSFSQEELQEVQKQLLLEFCERLNDNGIFFLVGVHQMLLWKV
jgi:hypothetical protein